MHGASGRCSGLISHRAAPSDLRISPPATVGPILAGLILDNYNPNLLWYLGGVLCLISVVGFYLLHLKLGGQDRFAPAPRPRRSLLPFNKPFSGRLKRAERVKSSRLFFVNARPPSVTRFTWNISPRGGENLCPFPLVDLSLLGVNNGYPALFLLHNPRRVTLSGFFILLRGRVCISVR